MTKVTSIVVKNDPLELSLPEWVDTNMTYELIWSETTGEWSVSPNPLRQHDEAMPF